MPAVVKVTRREWSRRPGLNFFKHMCEKQETFLSGRYESYTLDQLLQRAEVKLTTDLKRGGLPFNGLG